MTSTTPPAARPEEAGALLAVNYLLADTTLFGGVKIVLRQAEMMARRGHRVTVVSPGAPPDWTGLEAAFLQVPELAAEHLPAADVHVATYWTTVAAAASAATGQGAHYCQGFEAMYEHNQAEHPAILEAYRRPLPGLVLSPHLGELLRARFGRPSRHVPPLLDGCFAPDARTAAMTPPRILILSPFEITWKGVLTGLKAIRELRAGGLDCQVVRVSQWPLTEAERAILEPDEYHHRLTPVEVARVIRGCDLMLAPSQEAEGFGLFVLEAMGSGVPVVASDIACFRGYAEGAAELVALDRPDAFAAAARGLLEDSERWRRARSAGLRRAQEDFGERRIGDRAEEALRWVASGRWRAEA